MRSRGTIVAIIIVITVILDQVLKIWVKTGFYLGEDMPIFSWFHLLFIENNGMAFGMTIGSKLALTLFRIVAVSMLIWYIHSIYRIKAVPAGYLACLAFITAGAAGNIFDCVFYGLIFDNPMPPQVAQLFPAGGGYAPLFMGKVVDMLYFPLFSFTWPSWIPLVGGDHFLFFQPVFNLADAAISCGIFVLIIFYHNYVLSPAALRNLSPDGNASVGEDR
ncbi:lipoprotein signal peptidase [uncultured Duncaniella sp.]|uniref:lipoprotein signal peptidase n=1 Tax=uncultured Duncaniella sp. TaxID=2768039 RepID=UPI0026755B63|nr:lipoprotein signal peptidase [uncultured Duncaniella sp.]MCI9172490.1 lipoprotein signal peptidase [Muribaculaceae bacterium]